MRAAWKTVTLAESGPTIVVEGHHDFPPESVRVEFLTESTPHFTCHWKDEASYYDIVVDGECDPDAALALPGAKESRGANSSL